MPFKVSVYEKNYKRKCFFYQKKPQTQKKNIFPFCTREMIITALRGLGVSYLLNFSRWNRTTG